MRLLPVLLVSLSVSTFGLINPNQSLSANLVAQLGGIDGLGDIENATTDILSGLGYDCQTAGSVGIACTKCTDEGSASQKCKAYICDAVTRECRQQEATLPDVPDSVDDLTDDIDVDPDVDTDDLNIDTDNIPGL
ncbi:MAG: hypothetical protein AB4372_40775 [Xenococcus sp. (in: cyanobacteria)]